MEYFYWFIINYLIIMIICYFIVIRKARRGKKVPSEVKFLIDFYKLDTKKFNYRKFLWHVGLVTAFDVSVVATFVPLINGLIFQILFGFIIIVPVVVVTYHLLGKYYQKVQAQYDIEMEEFEKFKKEKDKKKGKKKNVK